MALLLSTWTSLCFYLCNAVSLDTTALSFPTNAVVNVQIYINIVNPLDTAVYFNISAPRISSFTTKRELVPPKDVIVIELNTTEFEIKGTGISGKGVLIQSNDSNLIITGLSTAHNSGDMYFCRKAPQLGTEYIIIAYCDLNTFCQFTINAYEDSTIIEILLPRYFASKVIFNATHYGPGDVMTSTLQKSQTFQIQSTFDLTGIKIISTNNKRFSVLSGSSLTKVRTGIGSDYITDMVPPVAAWGSEYILVRRNSLKYAHDHVKFVTAASGANISIIGCGAVLYHQVQEFQTYLFNMTCERVHVISDEPVLIAHFPVSNYNGDPAMFFPTPNNHYVSRYTVYIPPGFRNCSIAFVMETRHVNTFDLSIFSGTFSHWEEIYQSDYSTTWVYGVSSGVYEIAHISTFGGHVICEDAWTMIAFIIGLGNWTQNETQEFFSTSTIAESSTTQRINDTVSSIAISDVITSQTQINVTESALTCTCCKTPSYSDSDLPPPEILLAIKDYLKKTLSVPKKTTSNYVRKLTSAWDERTSSAKIGVVGIVILCAIFGSIIAIDLAKFFQTRTSK